MYKSDIFNKQFYHIFPGGIATEHYTLPKKIDYTTTFSLKDLFMWLSEALLPRKPKRDRLQNKKTKKIREQKNWKCLLLSCFFWHVNERYFKKDNVIVEED